MLWRGMLGRYHHVYLVLAPFVVVDQHKPAGLEGRNCVS
jgi:hypothetical protein